MTNKTRKVTNKTTYQLINIQMIWLLKLNWKKKHRRPNHGLNFIVFHFHAHLIEIRIMVAMWGGGLRHERCYGSVKELLSFATRKNGPIRQLKMYQLKMCAVSWLERWLRAVPWHAMQLRPIRYCVKVNVHSQSILIFLYGTTEWPYFHWNIELNHTISWKLAAIWYVLSVDWSDWNSTQNDRTEETIWKKCPSDMCDVCLCTVHP